jgi:hypothetical protein
MLLLRGHYPTAFVGSPARLPGLGDNLYQCFTKAGGSAAGQSHVARLSATKSDYMITRTALPEVPPPAPARLAEWHTDLTGCGDFSHGPDTTTEG